MTVPAFAAVHKIRKNSKLQPFLTMGHDKSAVRDAKHKAGCLALRHRWMHFLPEYIKNNIRYWRIGVQNPTR
jgi:hypothetical protein